MHATNTRIADCLIACEGLVDPLADLKAFTQELANAKADGAEIRDQIIGLRVAVREIAAELEREAESLLATRGDSPTSQAKALGIAAAQRRVARKLRRLSTEGGE